LTSLQRIALNSEFVRDMAQNLDNVTFYYTPINTNKRRNPL